MGQLPHFPRGAQALDDGDAEGQSVPAAASRSCAALLPWPRAAATADTVVPLGLAVRSCAAVLSWSSAALSALVCACHLPRASFTSFVRAALTLWMSELISVAAPADAQQVIAILPGGEIKRLAWNAITQRWEARFDIPTYATEGAYVITIIVVRKEGTRQMLTMRYHVDLTPPRGAGRVQVVGGAAQTTIAIASSP